jgi:hypothetical protein
MASYFDSYNGDTDDEIESNLVETFGALPYQYESRRLNRIDNNESLPYQYEPRRLNRIDNNESLPYQYEPRRLNRIDSNEPIINEVPENVGGAANNEDIGRVGNVEWCRCGNCVPILTCQESICCKEIEEVAEKICV